jgi:hypothetical protein
MINPEHSRKALREQLDILIDQSSRYPDEDLPYEFLRDHSLAIVQLCNQLIDARAQAANDSAVR